MPRKHSITLKLSEYEFESIRNGLLGGYWSIYDLLKSPTKNQKIAARDQMATLSRLSREWADRWKSK